jgi:MFS family permease
MLGFAFDIYEATIMQLVTPLLIKEWGIAPATIGNITTVSRWVGLIGIFVFPTLADLYGRRPVLVLTILGLFVVHRSYGLRAGPAADPARTQVRSGLTAGGGSLLRTRL